MDKMSEEAQHVVNMMKDSLAAKRFIQVFPHFNKTSGLNPNQAMVYQTLLSVGRASEKSKYCRHNEDGRMWVQISIPYLLEFMGWAETKEKTLRRVLKDMEDVGLVASLESDSYNRAKWYHLVGLWRNIS